MMNRLFYNPVRQARVTSRESAWFLLVAVFLLATALPGLASSDAPQWMHALVGVPLPTYDEKTDAVLLYSDTNVTVLSADKIRTHVREAYKILRPGGRTRGIAFFSRDHRLKPRLGVIEAVIDVLKVFAR